MGVLRDWRCLAHGDFESMLDEPRCPHGCTTVEKVFLQPPGFFSPASQNIDSNMEKIAKSYGLTDMNNRGGKPVITPDANKQRQAEEYARFMKQKFGDGWGTVQKGGNLNVATGQISGGGPGVAGSLSQYHAQADNVLAEVKPALTPKPVLVRHDHENLQVRTA